MKHTTKITAFLLLVCLCLPLFSCSDGTVDTDGTSGEEIELGDPEYICGTMDMIVYDDTLYYKGKHTNGTSQLRCYDLTDVDLGDSPLIDESISESPEKGSAGLGRDGCFFLIDPWQTKKNNGNPVVILSNTLFNKTTDTDYERLFSYNTITHKVTLIKDEIDIGLQDVCLYGDTIFYSCNEGRDGFNVYRVDINGENYMKMENRYRRAYFVYGVYDGRVY